MNEMKPEKAEKKESSREFSFLQCGERKSETDFRGHLFQFFAGKRTGNFPVQYDRRFLSGDFCVHSVVLHPVLFCLPGNILPQNNFKTMLEKS
jgi:hypothetical protein